MWNQYGVQLIAGTMWHRDSVLSTLDIAPGTIPYLHRDVVYEWGSGDHELKPHHAHFAWKGPSWALFDFFIGAIMQDDDNFGPPQDLLLCEWLVGTVPGGSWLEILPPVEYHGRECLFAVSCTGKTDHLRGVIGTTTHFWTRYGAIHDRNRRDTNTRGR